MQREKILKLSEKKLRTNIMKKRFFTGIKPTGILSLAHYLGVIRNVLALQQDYEIFFMIADLHALTIPNKELNLFELSKQLAALIYACGLEEKCKVFIQSEVSEHLELSYLISPQITVGVLNNMIQYKEKRKNEETGNLALLQYPVLMAADILIYSPDLVLVGQDQKQHLELTTEITKKFNNFLGFEALKIPSFEIPKLGAKIMSLENPSKKMSKTDSNYISLLDTPEQVRLKIFSAVTDSENILIYDPLRKPAISNLLTMYSLLKEQELELSLQELEGFNYHQFKLNLVEIINSKLAKIQKSYFQILPLVEDLIEKNQLFLKEIAKEKINSLKKALKLKKE